MKQQYQAYYVKGSTTARIDLRVRYDSYSEMSETARADFADGEAENQVEKIDLSYTQHYLFDYTHFLGNLLACENPFEHIKNMFVAVSDLSCRFFKYQLNHAEKDYKEFMSYGNFTPDFLAIFANNKRITFNRKLYELENGTYIPLKINSTASEIIYCYESTDIKDIIFSTIHFALENGYKLVQCSHCGRWFFKDGSRAGSNKKYCNRKSTFNGYEHLPCEQAVRNINQELQRKKKRIYNSMVREHLSTEQFVRDFLDECAEYMAKVKNTASVQNLSEYWDFLNNYKDGVKNGNNK